MLRLVFLFLLILKHIILYLKWVNFKILKSCSRLEIRERDEKYYGTTRRPRLPTCFLTKIMDDIFSISPNEGPWCRVQAYAYVCMNIHKCLFSTEGEARAMASCVFLFHGVLRLFSFFLSLAQSLSRVFKLDEGANQNPRNQLADSNLSARWWAKPIALKVRCVLIVPVQSVLLWVPFCPLSVQTAQYSILLCKSSISRSSSVSEWVTEWVSDWVSYLGLATSQLVSN